MRVFAVMAPLTVGRRPVLEACQAAIHGSAVNFAILEQADIDLDVDDERHAHAVLIRVQAFSCNYREQARFLNVARQPEGKGYLVLGSEFAATVVKVGPQVHDLRPGDRVFGNGAVDAGASHLGLTTQRGSAELQICHRSKLMRFPDAMSMAEAAAFSVGAQTAYALVRRLELQAGQHVLVTAAASNTALFALHALHARGQPVHALTTSPHIQAHLAARGITRCCVLDRRQAAAPALGAYLAQQGIERFDAVIDPFMDVYLRKLVPHLQRGGKYITCGVYEQFRAPPDPFPYEGLSLDEMFSLIIRKSLHVIGNNLGEEADLRQALADYDAGRLPVALDGVFGPGQLAHFVQRSCLAKDRVGKVVFDYSKNNQGDSP